MTNPNIAPFVTLSEAATIAKRSYAWAWDRAADGRFDVRHFSGSRSMYVTMESLRKVLDAETPLESAEPPVLHLGLAWENPAKGKRTGKRLKRSGKHDVSHLSLVKP